MHLIYKCTPEIRKAIHKNGDILYTNYGRHKIRDRYRVVMCHYCQGYGHFAADCRAKQNGKLVVCGKCADNHETKDCNVNIRKCHHCQNKEHADAKHAVFDRSCPTYAAELKRLAENTDHGF